MNTITRVQADPLAPDRGAIEAIVQARHGDPFAVLGPHAVEGGTAIRAFIPGADAVTVMARGQADMRLGELALVDPAGVWSGVVASSRPRMAWPRWTPRIPIVFRRCSAMWIFICWRRAGTATSRGSWARMWW